MKNFPQYLTHGSGFVMTLDASRLLIAFKQPHELEEVRNILQELELVLEGVRKGKETDESMLLRHSINHTDQRFWVRSKSGKSIDEEHLKNIQQALKNDIEWIGPVYRLDNDKNTIKKDNDDETETGKLLCPLPNVLLIKFMQSLAPSQNEDPFSDIVQKLQLKEVPEKSKYLGDYCYFYIESYIVDNTDNNTATKTAYQLRDILFDRHKQLIQDVRFENMPMIRPVTVRPNDEHYSRQWNMEYISAGGMGTSGWDISTGNDMVVICILDTGCDLLHPDLRYSSRGINLGTMASDGSPSLPTGDPDRAHGTACAGIAAATFDNQIGVSGVAGNCRILPVARQNSTDVEVATGIRYAADNGAKVISMSFGCYGPGEGLGPTGWDFGMVDPAIEYAFGRGCVLCASTGNESNSNYNRYPARHRLVIAVGASDETNNHASFSNYGPGVSVVAPGVDIPTTDIQGVDGSSPDDYTLTFGGTSAAVPHVSGLAALLFSAYPMLTNVQVRNIIERTASKIGPTTLVYSDEPGFPNGTRNQQMGYGRIDVYAALDLADVMIRDWPGDAGIEPSTPPGGNFWEFSDIVIRPTSTDMAFIPEDPVQSNRVVRGQPNYLNIRVKNLGMRPARNVEVRATIVAYVGLEFVYPDDWDSFLPGHIRLRTGIVDHFTTVDSNGSNSEVIAKFPISTDQIEQLWGWQEGMNWHPCILAVVTAINDNAFHSETILDSTVLRRNNIAQRNLSVVAARRGTTFIFPFFAGHPRNMEMSMDIVVEANQIPKDMKVLVSLDDSAKAFPQFNLRKESNITATTNTTIAAGDENKYDAIAFLDSTRIETRIGHHPARLTLKKGSRMDFLNNERKVIVKKGGKIITKEENGKRFVELTDSTCVIINIEKQPGQLYPMSLQTSIPTDAENGKQYVIKVYQKDTKGKIVGGATAIYYIK